MHLIELHCILPIQIEQAARRGNEHIHAFAQLHHLRVDTHTAVGGQASQVEAFAVFDKALQHLFSQFTRGHQHENARAVAGHGWAMLHQPLQERQRKARRFASARLRRCHDVLATEHGRNRLDLHRRRCPVIEVLQITQQGIDQAKRGKRHGRIPAKTAILAVTALIASCRSMVKRSASIATEKAPRRQAVRRSTGYGSNPMNIAHFFIERQIIRYTCRQRSCCTNLVAVAGGHHATSSGWRAIGPFKRMLCCVGLRSGQKQLRRIL
ncbi:hypothetical protein J2802_005802 [Paraburkholderia caribensis]|nr:hypothetical protein [Paraburkholderia caribensis]